MRSQYGKETEIVCEPKHPLLPQDIQIIEVPSTFNPSKEMQEKIKKDFEDANWGEDGTKWRYEGTAHGRGGLIIGVSPIMYSNHFVMRKIKGLNKKEYPRPFTVNTLQRTIDDKLLIVVRDFGSDQKGLAAAGSGFEDRYTKDGKNLPPSHPYVWNMREMLDEVEYFSILPFFTEKARFLGTVRGSNTDVSAIFCQALEASSNQVSLNPANIAYNGKPEHSDLWTVDFTQERFQQFLEQGGMYNPEKRDQFVEAPDHLLGGIELTLNYWDELPR